MRAEITVKGRRYVLLRDTSCSENAILSGEAIRVDIGEPLLVWAVPVDERGAARS